MPANYHLIKPGGGTAVPSRVLFIDVEPSVQETNSPRGHRVHSFGVGFASACRLHHGQVSEKFGMVLNRAWVLFALLADFADRHKATWVFGHNLGYDLTLLGFWDWLPRSGATLVDAVLEDPPTSITIRWDKRLVKFVDVMNYWRLSVADLGQSLGFRPTADTTAGSRQSPDPDRCRAHVEVIERCMLKLIGRVAETRCCSLRTTAAGLSWATYLRSFLDRTLYVPSDKRSTALARAGYSGGLVEVSHHGAVRQLVSVLDTNSLYPSVMANNLFPCRLVKRVVGLRARELKTAMRYYDAVARVDLVDCVPGGRGGDYAFPGLGGVSGVTALAGNELSLALDRGQIKRVLEVCLYERADLFSSFVRHNYQRKCDAAAAGNGAEVMFQKLLLNSLHGKFAQKGRRWTDAPDINARGYYAYWWHKVRGVYAPLRARALAGNTQLRVPGPEPRNAFPAISACVTALGRAALRADIAVCGRSSFLYADTDSVHCLGPGLSRLTAAGRVHQSRLGCLRLEQTGGTAEYWGPRHYRVGDRWCLAGVKADAVQVADGVYLQDAMMGVERVLEAGGANVVGVSQRTVRLSARSHDARKQYGIGAAGA